MKNKSFLLLSVLLIISAFYSLNAWMFIGLPKYFSFALGAFLLFLSIINKQYFQIKNTTFFLAILIFFITTYELSVDPSVHINLNFFIGNILSLCGIFVILFLKDNLKCRLINYFDKWMFYITIVSVFFWVLYLIKIPLPHFNFEWQASVDSIYSFKCYFFFLFWDRGLITDIFPRFSSIFYEPGYYSIILIFLLSYHRFDYKKWHVIVYTIALIFSLSLVGVLMYIIMFTTFTLIKSKKGIIYVVFVFISFSFISDYFRELNGGHNFFNEMILVRMEIEDGKLAGYNRTSEDFNDIFDTFLTTGGKDLLLGVSSQKVKEINKGNVGYKFYTYKYGLLCTSLFLGSLLLAYYPYRRKMDALFMVLLFIMMFARGHLVMWYTGYWLLFICAMAEFSKKNNLNKYYSKRV